MLAGSWLVRLIGCHDLHRLRICRAASSSCSTFAEDDSGDRNGAASIDVEGATCSLVRSSHPSKACVLHNGQSLDADNHLWMQSRWKAWVQASEFMIAPDSKLSRQIAQLSVEDDRAV